MVQQNDVPRIATYDHSDLELAVSIDVPVARAIRCSRQRLNPSRGCGERHLMQKQDGNDTADEARLHGDDLPALPPRRPGAPSSRPNGGGGWPFGPRGSTEAPSATGAQTGYRPSPVTHRSNAPQSSTVRQAPLGMVGLSAKGVAGSPNGAAGSDGPSTFDPSSAQPARRASREHAKARERIRYIYCNLAV